MLDGEVLTAPDADVAIAAARAAVAARRAGAARPAAAKSTSRAPQRPVAARAADPGRRERVLGAALDDGRLVEPSLPAWRQRFDRDPDGTERLLSQLASAPMLARRRHRVAAAAAKPPAPAPAPARADMRDPAIGSVPASAPVAARAAFGPGARSDLRASSFRQAMFGSGSGRPAELTQAEYQERERARLARAGIDSGATVDGDDPRVQAMVAKLQPGPIGSGAMSHGSRPAAAAPSDPGPGERLTRTEHGNVLYAGVPTRPSPNGGAPQVFFGTTGWTWPSSRLEASAPSMRRAPLRVRGWRPRRWRATGGSVASLSPRRCVTECRRQSDWE